MCMSYYITNVMCCTNLNYFTSSITVTFRKPKQYLQWITELQPEDCDVRSILTNMVSGPMLNPVPKSVNFMDYLNFGSRFMHTLTWYDA